ncbi:MAG: type II toxin-antitoxin system RelE/ParE family toxin [Magnetococcales bacterium]|nr:type II toxin-antitoxin system RelE/ParE family toxin [Magnetococcales bacterium]MBF0262747.1 type II toxin-antitoxin system RelE/ParE family toxin [Magnetococcales bacterium]
MVISPAGRRDLKEIWRHIAMDHLRRADSWLDSIHHTMRLLADHPHMGIARPELADGLRSHPIGQYTIFYLPMPNGIHIIRVIHSARDIPASLGASDHLIH